MRWLLPLLLISGPVAAWEFSPLPVCTLRHAGDAAEVVVTYDPSLPEYAISVTLVEGVWPEAPVFSIAFLGAAGSTIATDRHGRSGDGRTLTVTDRGFGNVLDGLEFNGTALARAGETSVPISLDGAAGPVRDFRACPAPALS